MNQSEKDRLYSLYYEREKEFDKACTKRLLLTYFGFVIGYIFVLFICASELFLPDNAEVIDSLALFAALIIPSLVIAGIHFFINFSIFDFLFKKDREASETLAAIKKHISELE